mgnify:CR=1 FL=1
MPAHMRIVLLAIVLLFTACSKKTDEPASTPPPTMTKDPAAAKTMIAGGAVVLDVRTTDEYRGDHLQQAVNIPIQDFSTRIAEVEKLTGGDKSKPIVVHCAKGGRAAKAKQQLESAGYTTVVNGGGLDDLR